MSISAHRRSAPKVETATAEKMGPWQATALVVGSIVGVAIFSLPYSLVSCGPGPIMDRLSALSAAFLSAEDVDPESSMVIGSFAVLAGPAPSLDELRTLVEERLPRRATASGSGAACSDSGHRVAGRSGLRRTPPRAPGRGADARRHGGGGRAGGPHHGRRMDRDHPLWDITLCEGLGGGRWGLICRIHHALADGVSGTALLRVSTTSRSSAAPPRSGCATGRRVQAAPAHRGRARRGAWCARPRRRRWCRCTAPL